MQEQSRKIPHRRNRWADSASPPSKPNITDLPREWSVRNVRGSRQLVLAPDQTDARSAPATTRLLPGCASTCSSAPAYIPCIQTSDNLIAENPPSYRQMVQPLSLNRGDSLPLGPPISHDNDSIIYNQPVDGQVVLHGNGSTPSPNDQIKLQHSGASNVSLLVEANTRAEQLQEKPRIRKLLKLARKEVHRALKVGKPMFTEHVTIPVEDLKGGHLPIFLWSIENKSNIRPLQSVMSALTTGGKGVYDSDGYVERSQPRAPYNSGELILHTIVSEDHVKLGVLNSGTCAEREAAVQYQVIEGKSRLQVSALLNSFRIENRNIPETVSNPGTSSQVDAAIIAGKQIIYDIAENSLHAFVPIE